MVHKVKEKIPIWQLQRIDQETGHHWFEKGAMKFFDSKIPKYAYKKGDYAYFISSEQFHSPTTSYHSAYSLPRKWSLRKTNLKTGDTTTAGDFQQYESYDEAKKKLKELIE